MNNATLPPSAGGYRAGRDPGDRVPGVVVVLSGGAAGARAMPVGSGSLVLGRGEAGLGKLDDGRVSRRHALVAFYEDRCMVTDLGSQNGTLVDGEPVEAHVATPAQRVVRVGDSLLLPCADVRPFEIAGMISVDGFVRGPAMQAVLEDARRAGYRGAALHVRGESGTGKEGVAQAFHRAGPHRARSLVTVNCAAIPHAIAERLLFGARRGAYSGAEADAIGYLQEADGGTIFLDEIAELEPQVQAKLLRVLESGDLLPLGASQPRKVDFGLVSATNKDLRELVAAGTFREDLYFRIGRPAVTLPALRDRTEEIPALIVSELARMSPASTAHVSLVELCLLRPWPGNVRELLTEIRVAAQSAIADGNRVTAHHLAATAGSAFARARPSARNEPVGTVPPPPSPTSDMPDLPHRRMPRVDAEWRLRIEDALRLHAGNVAATARALGLHRTQLRRLIDRHGILVDAVADAGDDEADG